MASGYDVWRLQSPPEVPTCDCGDEEVRILDSRPICHECYLEAVDGWDWLQTPAEHAQDLADEMAEYGRHFTPPP